ncbi:hypothetical protein ACQJBY_028935 [Aegilops geniculata]
MGQTHSQAKPKPDRHATPQPPGRDHHQEHPEAATGRRPPAAPAMDTFFLSHGSPTLSIDEAIPARSFFQSWLPAAVAGPERPRAVLIVSAHWETATPAVNVIRGANDTIHDFYGFPKSMYQLNYPAPGAPDLAKRTKELLEHGGFGPVKEDRSRGLDHGAWVPLMLMYPEADVPVCQLSVQPDRDAAYHYNLGRALAPLREEGVLVLGSGSATHNLRKMGPSSSPPPQWASDFDTWLKDSLLGGRYDDVNRYEERAPNAKTAHPRPEHLYPLHVALGAAGDESTAELIHSSWTNASLSYASYRFTTKN